METNSPPSCSTCGAWWRLPLLLVLVLAAILLWHNRGIKNSPSEPSVSTKNESIDATSGEHVTLGIDFGDGRRQVFDSLAWHEGITVADLMRSAPDVPTTQQGSGETAFLTSIYGVANEGAGGKNWTYEVNGESADRSFAVYVLHSGDRVLWSFGKPR